MLTTSAHAAGSATTASPNPIVRGGDVASLSGCTYRYRMQYRPPSVALLRALAALPPLRAIDHGSDRLRVKRPPALVDVTHVARRALISR
jgi:hypothetical protein